MFKVFREEIKLGEKKLMTIFDLKYHTKRINFIFKRALK